MNTNEAQTAQAVTEPETTLTSVAAQHALLQALNDTLRSACAEQVAAFEGDGRCQIQVIGLQASDGLPWAPALLMSHRLPTESLSAERADDHCQWAFRLALPSTTTSASLAARLTSCTSRLGGIRKALVMLNRNLGWVDNHDKDAVFQDQMDDFGALMDRSGLQFVRCPDKDATVGHVRQPACPALTKGKLENWIAKWGSAARQYKSAGLPDLTSDFLASLRPSGDAGLWLGTWRCGPVEVRPRCEVNHGVETLALYTTVESRLPPFDPEEREDDEGLLWQDFGQLQVDGQRLGMSPAAFMAAVDAGANPFAPTGTAGGGQPAKVRVQGDEDDGSDEACDDQDDEEDVEAGDALDEEDRELLQAYRENIHAAAKLQDAQNRYWGRAENEGEWVAQFLDATGQLDGVPEWLRPHIRWEGVAKQLRVDGAVYLVESAGWTWAFRTH